MTVARGVLIIIDIYRMPNARQELIELRASIAKLREEVEGLHVRHSWTSEDEEDAGSYEEAASGGHARQEAMEFAGLIRGGVEPQRYLVLGTYIYGWKDQVMNTKPPRGGSKSRLLDALFLGLAR